MISLSLSLSHARKMQHPIVLPRLKKEFAKSTILNTLNKTNTALVEPNSNHGVVANNEKPKRPSSPTRSRQQNKYALSDFWNFNHNWVSGMIKGRVHAQTPSDMRAIRFVVNMTFYGVKNGILVDKKGQLEYTSGSLRHHLSNSPPGATQVSAAFAAGFRKLLMLLESTPFWYEGISPDGDFMSALTIDRLFVCGDLADVLCEIDGVHTWVVTTQTIDITVADKNVIPSVQRGLWHFCQDKSLTQEVVQFRSLFRVRFIGDTAYMAL